ncbi:DUF551 domain-containing protein [Salmonella enterica]|nr:DUF551 domain-containing protein [Salmonella enterica]EBR8600426.1 DUF551 domain-containing protein [Salmonella enterica subsp. enterica serovar Virchow]ECI1682090.1 DUF551 domain-containing protein [Salmonella enterica subsp. enterica serovar Tennessee]HAE1090300.1 DUF551 domain-containing protein [Salmonella enterica subsp. enterica serovar Montevideo]EDA9057100.1 DUF551 domain-containing protein [Salmonella enterica subsp. enterica serovar Virchow]
MSAITKERIELFIKNPLENGLTRGEQMELARIALASLEAEPVAWAHRLINKRNGVVHPWVYGSAEACPSEGDIFNIEVMPLYTVPPAPVSVPDAMEMDDDFDSAFEHGKAVGWNAYRAAMLQSGNFRENKNSSTNNFREIAETSTNYPVIPSEVLSAIQKVAKIRADFDDFDGDRRGIGDCLDEAEQELIVTINKYASQLAAEPIAPNDVREQTAIPQVPVTPDGWISCSERMPIIGELNWRTSFPLLITCEIGVIPAYYGFVRVNGNKHYGFMESLKYGDDSGNHPQTNEYDLISNVTHWMPLPEPQQEVNRG